MLLVPRFVAISIVLVAIIAILALSVGGYLIAIGSIDAGTTKSRAETVLFVGILLSTIMFLSLIFAAGRTRRISRELDKMIAVNKYGDFSPEMSLKRFGRIGEQITLLYFRLNALSEKRSLKISALSDLVQILISNVATPLVVSGPTGEIAYANSSGGIHLGTSRSELQSSNIGDVLDWIDIHEVVARLERGRATLNLHGPVGETHVVPTYNRLQELSYLVWVLEPGGFRVDKPENSESRRVAGAGLRGALNRLLGPTYRNKERS